MSTLKPFEKYLENLMIDYRNKYAEAVNKIEELSDENASLKIKIENERMFYKLQLEQFKRN